MSCLEVVCGEIALGIFENAKLYRNAGSNTQQWSQGALIYVVSVYVVKGTQNQPCRKQGDPRSLEYHLHSQACLGTSLLLMFAYAILSRLGIEMSALWVTYHFDDVKRLAN